MGHNALATIPRTRRWREVVEALGDGAPVPEVVAASASAAESDLLGASKDPVAVEAVRLLLTIPFAARSEDFGAALREADVSIGSNPDLLDLMAAVTSRLDEVRLGATGRSDFGEIAARALTSTFSTALGDAMPGLFGATPDAVRNEARRLSWSNGISELCRRYFSSVISRTMSYWLDRTLSAQTGPGLRFADAGERGRFDVALDEYSFETTRIIKEFAGGWYGKTLSREGSIRTHDAAVLCHAALSKIVREMRMRTGVDA